MSAVVAILAGLVSGPAAAWTALSVAGMPTPVFLAGLSLVTLWVVFVVIDRWRGARRPLQVGEVR